MNENDWIEVDSKNEKEKEKEMTNKNNDTIIIINEQPNNIDYKTIFDKYSENENSNDERKVKEHINDCCNELTDFWISNYFICFRNLKFIINYLYNKI